MTEAVVDVVIVTFGGADELPGAVEAVRAQGDVVGRIVVVDNASPDGAAQVAQALVGVEVVANPTNAGYAAAMNQGLALTSAPYLLSLNADAVLQPGYVSALVERLEASPRTGGATGLLVRPDGTVDSTGISLTRAYWAAERAGGASPDAARHESATPFGVSGAAALWRRAMLDDLGPAPWWEWLFVYWDDVELCWRARNRGWDFAFVPGATATHRRGAATGEPTFTEGQAFRNRMATLARHRGWPGVLAPGSLAVTTLTAARLGVRHPAALRRAAPVASIRAGLEAGRGDGDRQPLPATLLSPHPWRVWLGAQLRRGRGARAAASRSPR